MEKYEIAHHLTNKEALTEFCFVVKHVGGGSCNLWSLGKFTLSSSCNLWSLKNFTSAYLSQVAREKS